MQHTASNAARTTLAALACAAALGLAGCSIGFIPQQDEEQRSAAPTPEADAPATGADGGTGSLGTDNVDDADLDADDLDDLDDDDLDDDADDLTRDKLEAAVQKTITCPNGSVDIADIGSVIELDDDCAKVEVSGSGTVLLADDIDALTVTGTGIVVYADEVRRITVTGSDNAITWEDGKPQVRDTGVNNTLAAQR